MATFLNPGRRSSTSPDRCTRKLSGMTLPERRPRPTPSFASITRSSAPVTGFWVNMTPATSGSSSACTTTPTLGRWNRPTRCRYVIAESELADHQISLSASRTSSHEGTLRRQVLTREARPRRPRRRPRSARRAGHRALERACRPPRSRVPRRLRPPRRSRPSTQRRAGAAAPGRLPNPTAFEPKSASSCASASSTTFLTSRAPLPVPCRRRRAPVHRR